MSTTTKPSIYRITDGGDVGLLVADSALPELFPGTPVEPVEWDSVPQDQPILARVRDQLVATYRNLLLIGQLAGLTTGGSK